MAFFVLINAGKPPTSQTLPSSPLPINAHPHGKQDSPPQSTFAPDPPQLNWTHRPLPDPPHTNWTYSPNTGFAPLSLGRTAPFQIRPTQIGLTAPIRDSPHYRLDAPPPSRSAPHKLDLQPQYGIPPCTAPTHIRPNPHSPPSTLLQLNWTHRPLLDPLSVMFGHTKTCAQQGTTAHNSAQLRTTFK